MGQIAYVGADDSIWLINADGSGRKKLVDKPAIPTGRSVVIGQPKWRPDGRQLLYQVTSYGKNYNTYDVVIIDLAGDLVKDVPYATSASWSPDGKRLGLLSGVLDDVRGVLTATPTVYTIATEHRVSVGPTLYYTNGPEWRPRTEELSFQNYHGMSLVQADGSGTQMILPAWPVADWSPDGRRLSLRNGFAQCGGYAVYDVETNKVVACGPEPPHNDQSVTRTAEDGQTSWSPDGRLVAYHEDWSTAKNQNGVYVVDVTSDRERLLPGQGAQYVTFAPDSDHLAFEATNSVSGGHSVWVGDAKTGEVSLLAEGSQPAWRPVID